MSKRKKESLIEPTSHSLDLHQLQWFCSQTQDELYQNLLEKILPMFYTSKKITGNNSFIYVKGNIPIMLLAHMDTVFSVPPNKNDFIFEAHSQTLSSPIGLGADDRAGIYGIYWLLTRGWRPYILFLKDEERGGIGAIQAAKTLTPPANLRYLIEIDRQGHNDCVFYNDSNSEFIKYVESFDFVTKSGLYSDISFICPVWKISGVNVSMGAYNCHSFKELLVLPQLQKTLDKIERMLETPPPSQFIYKPLRPDIAHYCDPWIDNERYDRYSYGAIPYSEQQYRGISSQRNNCCMNCFSLAPASGMKEVGMNGHYCVDCYLEHCFLCNGCHSTFDARTHKYIGSINFLVELCKKCGIEAAVKLTTGGVAL